MPGQAGIVIRALSWNLHHGRDFPPDRELRTWRSRLFGLSERNATHVQVNHPLFAEFAGLVARWDWDVAFLQEAPPRWFRPLAERARANGAIALTSRNRGAFARGLAAAINPDLIASGEGGSNQLLLRPGRILEVRRHTLAEKPERRRALFARLDLGGGRRLCAANLHATASRGDRAAGPEVVRAAELAVEWAGADPVLFGGDLNLRPETCPRAFEALGGRLGLGPPTSPKAIDHLLARGLEVVEPPHRLPPERRELARRDGRRIRLSDHAPVVAAFSMK